MDRAVRILTLLAEAPGEGLSASAVCSAAGLAKGTGYRLLQSLEGHGLVRRTNGRQYLPGRRLLSLAASSLDSDPLHQVAVPSLERITRLSGESSFLIVRQGMNSLCLARRDGSFAIRALHGGLGGSLALGIGPGSLVLLAFQSEEERLRIIAHNRATLIGTHFPDELSLLADIETIRRDGFARDAGRFFPEVFGLAVPVLDTRGVILAAVSVSAVIERMTEQREHRILSELKAAAGAIASGCNPMLRHL